MPTNFQYADLTFIVNKMSGRTETFRQLRYPRGTYFDFDIDDLDQMFNSIGLFLNEDIDHYKEKLLLNGCFSIICRDDIHGYKTQFIVVLNLISGD